jgi:PII-like signaling protein
MKHLFNLVNELPTVFEVVTGATKKQVKRSLQSQTTVEASLCPALKR